MKIYNSVTIDMKTLMTVEEDSFEYEGPIALCGGGSAGGGSAGGQTIDADLKEHYLELMDGSASSPTVAMTTPFFDVINTAIAAGGNPFTGESAYDPSVETEHMQDAWDTTSATVTALSYSTSWQAMIDSAVAKLSSVGLVNERQFSTTIARIVAEALQQSLSIVSGHITDIRTNVQSIAGDVQDGVVAKVDTLFQASKSLANVHGLNTSYQALNQSKEYTSALISDISTSILSQVSAMIQNAFMSAITVSESILTTMRGSFENRKRKDHLRAISRLSAGAADVNAVNSSSFIIGLALLEAEHADQLDMVDAENSFKLYELAIAHFTDAFKSMFNVQVGSFQSTVSETLQTIRGDAGLYAGLANTIAGIHAGLVQNLSASYGDAFRVAYGSQVDAQVKGDLMFDSLKQQYIVSGVAAQGALDANYLNSKVQMTNMQVDMDRIKLVAFSEQYTKDLQIDIGDARWDLESFQYAGNLMASISGGTVTTPQSMTTGQSVLSGALAGASVGASIPGAGVAGALIGGTIGAIGGYFSNK